MGESIIKEQSESQISYDIFTDNYGERIVKTFCQCNISSEIFSIVVISEPLILWRKT